jgi:uncharacterized membrane-anchored protein
MSKFAKAITAAVTGKKSVSPAPFRNLNIESRVAQDLDFMLRSEILVSAKFTQQAYIEDDPTKKTEAMAEFMKAIRRGFVEEMFGEFRPYIIEMQSATYDHDLTRLRTLLAKMEHQMFYEDI